ncbi:MAG: sugar transferase [Gaiellales bacterium]|nr:MAG: sugar transferase [Gaiellales bacterium]
MKRIIDIAVGLPLLLVSAPVMLLSAIAVKLTSKGPAFYRARRVGLGGREFDMLKLRTMVAGADDMGPPLTRDNDQRVTRIGAFIRRARLDELPQLINVLKGDMSLVGPRPEDPAYVSLYSEQQKRVLDVRPGITGPSQLSFSKESAMLDVDDYERKYVEEIMPRKLALDIDYVYNHGIILDLEIIFRTLLLPFRSG